MVPAGSAHLVWHRWSAAFDLKLPLFVRTSSASYPPEVQTRPLGFMPVVTLGGAFRALTWFRVGASMHATFVVLSPIDPARDVGRSGKLATGGGPFALFSSSRFMARLDFLGALGGPLAGTMSLGASIGVSLPY